MLITTKCIVLSKIKYKDNDLIVKCYTENLGIVSFLLRHVLKSKKGSTKIAYFQPLSLLQLVIQSKENRSLQIIKETKSTALYSTLHTDVFKSSIVMFLTEVLSSALREEEQNQILYTYLETSLLWLDANSEYSNFHLLFLLKLTKYLGFYPDTSNNNRDYFDLLNGKFVAKSENIYTISGDNLLLLKQLLGTTFDALNMVKINAKQRQSFLNMILRYFELHLGNFKPPKSLQVLNQVFS